MNIDQIINMRAELKATKGLAKIKKTIDFYSAMEEFLDGVVCPICKNSGTTILPVKPGIDGVKCSLCFHNGVFINLIRRRDLIGENDYEQ